MRMMTDFAPGLRLHMLVTSALFWLLAFAFSTYSLVIVYDSWNAYHETPLLKEKLVALAETVNQKQLSQLPARESMSRLRKRIANINSLAPKQVMSSAKLIEILEQLTPRKVAYRSIQYDPEQGLLKLSAESYNARNLTMLLFELEKRPEFRNVILRKQSREKIRKQLLIRYEIGLKVLH